jgi:hypothetical protein
MQRRMLILALALAGCSTAPPRVGEAPPHVADAAAESSYHQVFERWTRHDEVYDVLDTRMFVAATLESADFRRAKVERLALFQGLPNSARDAELSRELAQAEKGYAFFMGVHTPDSRINDFDRPWSIWRVALHTSAGEVTPTEIVRLGRPDANTRGIYLYLGDFWIGYRVQFPATLPDGRPVLAAEDRELALRLSSAVGKAEMLFPAAPVSIAPGNVSAPAAR